MAKIGVAELKARLSEHLRSVRRGGEIVVCDRNEPIARLVPYEARGSLVVREPVREYRSLGDIKLPPGVRLGVDAVEMLLEDRRREK